MAAWDEGMMGSLYR